MPHFVKYSMICSVCSWSFVVTSFGVLDVAIIAVSSA